MIPELRLGPRWVRWVALLGDFEAGRQFRDTQLEDHIAYERPLGALGSRVGGRFVERELERMFRHRHCVLREDLARHRAVRGHGLKRIAISGASGLVGPMGSLQANGRLVSSANQVLFTIFLLGHDFP